MKILLLRDVAKIGQKGEIVNIKEGYALNFIIPQKIGIKANTEVIKQKEVEESRKKEKKAVEEKLLQKNMDALKGKSVTIKSKTNKEGHLFAQIKISEILEAIEKQHNLAIPDDLIKLDSPIKEIGKYDLGVINLFVESE